MPYPPNPPDTSLFEDMSEEYRSAKLHFPSGTVPHKAATSSDALAMLVRDENWKGADELLAEMIQLDITITPDYVYENAAINVLESEFRGTRQQRAAEFGKWFMLVPSAEAARRSFYRIRYLMFGKARGIDIHLLMRFGLICASKGYITSSLSSQIISTIVRFSPPEISKQYLLQFQKCAVFYDGQRQRPVSSTFMSYIYSLGVRTQVLAGRIDAALSLMELAHERELQISDVTFKIFLEHAAEEDDITIGLQYRRLLSPSPDAALIVTDRSSTTATSVNLAMRLRYLRKAIVSNNPPTAYTLLDFIKDYRGTGRTNAIMMLRSKAYRHSYKPISLWVMAEMLYHRERNERVLTVFVYYKHFFLVGVPSNTIRKWMCQLHNLRTSNDKRWKMPPHMTSPQYPIKSKIWPSPYHTALVWEALCWLSPDVGQEMLYKSLLNIARSSEQQIPYSTTNKFYGNSLLMLPRRSVDPAHFSPFLKLHAKRGRSERAAAIIADMLKLGMQPTAYQWTIVSRGFAEFGDPDKAMHLLDRLAERARKAEGPLASESAEPQNNDTDYLADLENEGGNPNSMIITYTNVLRGFLRSGRLEYALEVEKRLLEECKYRYGDRLRTDDLVDKLRDLQSKHGMEATTEARLDTTS